MPDKPITQPIQIKKPILLSDPLETSREYFCRMTFAAKDRNLINQRRDEYLVKWNQKYPNRLNMLTCSIEAMTDGDYIVVKGKSMNGEAFSAMKIDSWWAQQEHIENIKMVNAWYMAIDTTEFDPTGMPQEKPKTGTSIWVILIPGIFVIGLIIFMIARKGR
jgi:hypothetical protein